MTSNRKQGSLTLNSCRYTPVYVIQNNSITQAGSYVLTPTVQEEQRPRTNNLKLFYEKSGGNIEKSLLINNVKYTSSPPVTKPVQEKVGNNLKLASFLVPKKDGNKDQYIVSNKILKPSSSSDDIDGLPNFNIVTTKPNGAKNKANSQQIVLKPRLLPKIKPKEKTLETTKHTSVHLLKLGGSYHSLNQLNDQQMRIVNKALENIQQQGNPERNKIKPTFDPVTNTKIVYKIVSPNDLKVVGKNKIIIKATVPKKANVVKEVTEEQNTIKKKEDIEEKPESIVVKSEPAEIKMTRSGRTVKLPKHILNDQDGSPVPKAKKKVSHPTPTHCLHCNIEFPTLMKLQRHYERHPSHLPARHSSLYQCLVAGLQGAGPDRAAAFVRQLEELLGRLKAILPCLLKKVDGVEGTACDINEDVGRLFGMNPGKYNLNVDALECVKDKDGCCKHDPPKPTQFHADHGKPSQLWLTKHQEETANIDIEEDHCARINPVDKWTVKRVWNQTQDQDKAETKNGHSKKLKLNCDVSEHIELGNETLDAYVESKQPSVFLVEEAHKLDDTDTTATEPKRLKICDKKPKTTHTQFYSTHFDIRSSPIKTSSTVFNKFQIVPEKLPLKFEAQLLRPLSFAADSDEHGQHHDIHNSSDNSIDLNGILKEFDTNDNHDSLAELASNGVSCKEADVLQPMSFTGPKEWSLNNPTVEQSQDNCMKPNSLIVPSILHGEHNETINPTNFGSNLNDRCTNFSDHTISHDNAVANDSLISDSRELNQGFNFLESLGNDCLSCPETELRNNSIDFSLDLFSFNHT